ncbi:MFS transporter [Streptomyces sp. NPDC056405]|uniref:MFS transporter n=1 Tax=Streptomyces sp. NPDC056405 TaxID=3345811 RepID=UPI0035E21CE2
MLVQLRTRFEAYRLYLLMEFGIGVCLGMAFATVVVYRVEDAHLSPLDLVLLGTVLETAYFVLQLPTGVLADAVSRRLSIVVGIAVLGGAFVMEGLLPFFLGIAAAQVVCALGFALVTGAQEAWIADEVGQKGLTRVYLRGSQAGLVGTLLGTVMSAGVATIGHHLPLIFAGAALVVIAGLLFLTMPETRRADAAGEADPDTKAAEPKGMWRNAMDSLGTVARLIRTGPGVLVVLTVVLVIGVWHESLDRLWGAHFLENYSFPDLLGLNSVAWFSVMSFGATLFGLGATQVVNKYVDDATASRTTLRMLFVLITLLMGTTFLFAFAGAFYLALVAYWAAMALRPSYAPLLNAWLMERTTERARATMLSAKDMFDSTGQFAGGPVVGYVGSAVSLRAALATAAAALAPALALLGYAMSRRVAQPAEPAAPHPEGRTGLEVGQ